MAEESRRKGGKYRRGMSSKRIISNIPHLSHLSIEEMMEVLCKNMSNQIVFSKTSIEGLSFR
jgi:hypothetical protein